MADLLKQRILIIQEKIPPYRVHLFEALAKCFEHQVTVLHSDPSTEYKEAAFRGLCVPQRNWGAFKFQSIPESAYTKFDVIIAMFDVRWLSTLRVLYGERKTRLILWGHGFGENQFINKWRLKFAHKADGLLLYDDSARRKFVNLGLLMNKIFIAPNTLFVPKHTQDWNTVRTNFLFIGRLQTRKRIDELLVAYHKIREKLPEQCKLIIVGDGTERIRLESMARELQLGNRIAFLGDIRAADRLAEIFNTTIAYVSPGAVGLGVLHSFAHGVPVITGCKANHGPEVNNIVEHENGCFYDDSIESLSKLLVQLADDRQWSIQLGRNAHKCYWNSRTMDDMVDGFKQAIQYVSNMQ